MEPCTQRNKSSIYQLSLLVYNGRHSHQHEKARVLTSAGVLGHGLGALRHGVLGQLTREQQAHGSLRLGWSECALVVAHQTAALGGDAVEDVVDERVHHSHTLLADTSLGVHLLEHLVDEML